MEALSRTEYPAMLDRLQPVNAASKFSERVKKIGKTNTEIADWLQERRKVEEAYVAGLKKLAKRPLVEVGGDLGIFDFPWKKILASTEEIASSHYLLSQQIEKDVEQPLRTFSNREMGQMPTIQGNLSHMAKDLEEAQEKSDKLSKKSGKANTSKAEIAAQKLKTADQLWNSQSPFIFENLQALDERRLNHLRDVLTQYETLQVDQIERNRTAVEQTLSLLVEVDTSKEIKNWSEASIAGKPITERKARQISNTDVVATSNMPPPPTPRSTHTRDDNQSEHSSKPEKESLTRRFGTMVGRRRQSIHGGFARAPSPSKGGFVPFGGRSSGSRDGRPSPSPRTSSNNLREGESRDYRLSSLAESPPGISPTTSTNGNTNGATAESSYISDVLLSRPMSKTPNGSVAADLADLSDVQPPPGPPPSHKKENSRDAEGFSVPVAMNDPITQAQLEASQDDEQPHFKLDIRNDPIPEQDADAQAALSSVANTLRSSQLTPSRKIGTTRGRRDVRNTIFIPNSLDVTQLQHPMPPSPNIIPALPAAVSNLSASENRAPSVSDTNSIRSGHSLLNNKNAPKHAEMHGPGLNASIIETIGVKLVNGVVQTSKVSGEIALVYNKSDETPLPPDKETIRINNFPNLEAIGPNRTFIHPVSVDKSDEFTINLSSISSKTVVSFTYRVHEDHASITTQGPLIFKPTWKSQGNNLNLLLEYHLNPALENLPVTFNNLVLRGFYEGSRASLVQTRPNGIHIKDKFLVYWNLGTTTVTHQPQKVICRLVGAEGAIPLPGRIEAFWDIQTLDPSHKIGSNISISRLESPKGKGKEQSVNDDPFADESVSSLPPPSPVSHWVDVETSKKFVNGVYEAREAPE